MIDLMFRADSQAAWTAFAASAGYTRDADGAAVPTEGVSIDEIGPVVTTPAVLDDEGEIITDAVLDQRHHVNVRLDCDAPPMISGPGVEWIDPATVTTPARIFAGGMTYWRPA